jgi:hypothetical protein
MSRFWYQLPLRRSRSPAQSSVARQLTTGYLQTGRIDNFDADLGGCGPLLVDVPGATPSHLVVALGKGTNAHVVNRDNMGGISLPVAQANVAPGNSIIQAAVTYHTNQNTYVAFRASRTTLSAFRITATNPPTIVVNAWSATRNDGACGSPFVTTTDGRSNPIVWTVGTAGWGIEGDQRLHGYDGETGIVVYAGGGPNELIPGTHSYSTTGIVARRRIYIAGDNKVYCASTHTYANAYCDTKT